MTNDELEKIIIDALKDNKRGLTVFKELQKRQQSLIDLHKHMSDQFYALLEDSFKPNIRIEVYDKHTKRKHVVGTDPHDMLLVNNGIVEYYNLQNGEGTSGDYEFVEKGVYDE